MTPEERKTWAYSILDRWTKEHEADEMLDMLEQVLQEQGNNDDLHDAITELEREITNVGSDVDRLFERSGDLESRVEDLEGAIEQAS